MVEYEVGGEIGHYLYLQQLMQYQLLLIVLRVKEAVYSLVPSIADRAIVAWQLEVSRAKSWPLIASCG